MAWKWTCRVGWHFSVTLTGYSPLGSSLKGYCNTCGVHGWVDRDGQFHPQPEEEK